jgi:hypothetical protein
VTLLKRPWIWLVVSALLLGVQIGPWYYPYGDADRYLSVARNLAENHRLTCLGSPHIFYPPGYAAIVSPLFLIRDRPFLELAVLHWLLAVAFMLGVYVWARRVVPEAAVWIAAVSVANNVFWIYHRRPASELAFITVLVWAVNSVNWVMRARTRRSVAAGTAVAAASLAMLCLIRHAGIAAAGGCSAAMLAAAWRRALSWRRAVAASLLTVSAALLTVGVEMAWDRNTAQAAGGKTYFDYLDPPGSDPARECGRYWRGLASTISEIGRVTIPGMLKCYSRQKEWLDINMLVYVPFFVLLATGWARWVRRQTDAFAWTLLFYWMLLTIWSWSTGGRYWFPMVPGLVVCAWFAAERLKDRRLALLKAVWLVHLSAAMAYWLAVDLPQTRELDRQWPAVDALAARIPVDSGPIAATESVRDARIMVALALDRPVRPEADKPDVRRLAEWIITTADDPPLDGFVPQCRAGRYCLLHRCGGEELP